MRVRLYLIIFSMIVSRSEVISQTTPTLLPPTEINGTVQLDISDIPPLNAERSRDEYLSVFVKNEADAYHSNPIQGLYKVEDDYLVFSPYYPFERGMAYVARIKYSDTDNSYRYQSFQVGKKQSIDEAKVVSIFPSANELPENLFRFYVYFNTPMKKGQALKHIKLVDAAGNIDNHAFMEFKQELWSADGKRLTLLFDPGRIKRGVSTNRALGPVLHEGNNYQLTISDAWQDVHGQALSIETTKEFVVGPANREHIVIKDLVIQKPAANSDDGLRILFDRLMDHALVQSMIGIADENNQRIPGHWETSEEEKIVQFIPKEPWKKGTYRIMIDSRMEDVAGNNVNNLLDQKIGKKNSNTQQLMRCFTI
ncbi:MAG: hypothetical protein R8G66_18080 [Cytophagales bacterium]|nr:hypothetical protein [Cytophagales bacterium]